MFHVTIAELIKLKILLCVDFLFEDIIQYRKYKIIDICQFSLFIKILGPKIGLIDPGPLHYKNIAVKINNDAIKLQQ